MASNDVVLAAIQLGIFSIPVSGEGVFYNITPEPIATVGKSLSGEGVANKIKGRRASIEVAAWPHDPAHAVLRAIALAQKATPGGVPLPGGAVDASSSQVATWTGGVLTQEPQFRAGEESEVATATFEVWGFNAVQG